MRARRALHVESQRMRSPKISLLVLSGATRRRR